MSDVAGFGESAPVLSVCVVAYNQAPYLERCLQSLVDQETDFPFDVIVGDDCSTDGSAEVIARFARAHPTVVKPIYRERNLGPIGNYFDTHRRATGQYVAHMDGDDYALPGKLQRQVERFTRDPRLTILWHRMLFFTDGGLEDTHPAEGAPYLEVPVTRADLLLYGPFGPHSSTMYRREQFSERYAEFDAIDWIFSVELIGDGIGIYMRDVLGAYRVHSQGMSGGAVANQRTRELLWGCQRELLRRFPQHRRAVALRAMFVAGLDVAKGNRFFTGSLRIWRDAGMIPDARLIPRLLRFFRYSRLPGKFAR